MDKIDTINALFPQADWFAVQITLGEIEKCPHKAICGISCELMREIAKLVPEASGLRFRVGREYDPVLYVVFIKTYYLGEKVKWKDVLRSLKRIAADHQADEADVIVDSPTELNFRIWWD